MADGGFVVHWDSVQAYGKTVAQQEDTLTRVNSALSGTLLSSDAFGKLPEARDLYQAYTQHANECLQITAKLPVQITQVADGLHSAAQAYAATESELASLIDNLGLGGGASRGAHGGSADDKFFSSLVHETAPAYDWTRKSCPALPAAKAPAVGQKGLAGILDDAINWIMSHVPDLMKLLDDVTGDTDALIRAANLWAQQGNQVNGVIRALREGAVSLPQKWAGDASTAFGTFMGEVTGGLTELVTVMGQTEKILQQAADVAAEAHDAIVDIIRDVAEWVIGNILVDALTLGLGTLFDAAATAAYLAAKAEQAEKVSVTLARVLRELEYMVQRMVSLKDDFKNAKGLGKLAEFATSGTRLYWGDKEHGLISAVKSGKVLEGLTGFGVRTGVRVGLAGQGVGVQGGLIQGGVQLAKVAALKPAEDLLHAAAPPAGSPGPSQIKQQVQQVQSTGLPKAEADLRAEGLKYGLVTPSVPQAPPANRIETMLNGHDPNPAPDHGQSAG